MNLSDQRVDSEGVLKIVQRMEFNYAHFWIEVLCFDGIGFLMECPSSMSLTSKQPTPMQWLEAEAQAESRYRLIKQWVNDNE